MNGFSLLLLLASLCAGPLGMAKDDMSQAYKNKFLIVMREGLALGTCSTSPIRTSFLKVRITETGADSARHGALEGMMDSDCQTSLQLIHKGEVLKSHHAALRGKWLVIYVESPRAITRGIGAFQHESQELASAEFMFSTEGGTQQLSSLLHSWLKIFDTQDEAARFGNTASGVFVKEVKVGMSPVEVEAALGLPQTKIELSEKTLYKYKDMTVEFRDGKVADVR